MKQTEPPYEQRIPYEQPVWDDNPFAGFEKINNDQEIPTQQNTFDIFD